MRYQAEVATNIGWVTLGGWGYRCHEWRRGRWQKATLSRRLLVARLGGPYTWLGEWDTLDEAKGAVEQHLGLRTHDHSPSLT